MAGKGGVAKHISTRLSPAEGRRFGLTLSGAFLVLAGVLWWRESRGAAGAAELGVLLMLAALTVPTRLGSVYRTWMRLGAAIATVTNPIILGMLYFLVFTPVGVVMRLVGRDPLKPPSDASSFWISRASGATRSNLERQF